MWGDEQTIRKVLKYDTWAVVGLSNDQSRAAYGVAHHPVTTTAELAEALSRPVEGRSIIEVRTDRHRLGELHRAIRAAVATAVQGLPQP